MVKQSTAPVTSKSEIVGTATYPEFDSENPQIGFEDIKTYDWSSEGYTSAEQAVVTLVNTQLRTNKMNTIRAMANPKLTKDKLDKMTNLAIARMSPSEQSALMAGTDDEILARIESLKTKLKTEFETSAAAKVSVSDETNE